MFVNMSLSVHADSSSEEEISALHPEVTFAPRENNFHEYSNHGPRSPTRGTGTKESSPLLGPKSEHHDIGMWNNFPDDPNFQETIRVAEDSIEHGMLPQRIYQGSSGSYFVKNKEGVCIFVVISFGHFSKSTLPLWRMLMSCSFEGPWTMFQSELKHPL